MQSEHTQYNSGYVWGKHTCWKQLRTLGSMLEPPKAATSPSCLGIWMASWSRRPSCLWSHVSPADATWLNRSGQAQQIKGRWGKTGTENSLQYKYRYWMRWKGTPVTRLYPFSPLQLRFFVLLPPFPCLQISAHSPKLDTDYFTLAHGYHPVKRSYKTHPHITARAKTASWLTRMDEGETASMSHLPAPLTSCHWLLGLCGCKNGSTACIQTLDKKCFVLSSTRLWWLLITAHISYYSSFRFWLRALGKCEAMTVCVCCRQPTRL